MGANASFDLVDSARRLIFISHRCCAMRAVDEYLILQASASISLSKAVFPDPSSPGLGVLKCYSDRSGFPVLSAIWR